MSAENRYAARELSIPELRAALAGRVITPEDGEYDAARTTYYAGLDRKPAVIVHPANAADVAHVVALARDAGIELSVRSGGHSLAGHSVSQGGIMLDLSSLKGMEIDAVNRTAWAEAGVTAGEYTEAAAAHGLATGFGDTGSVGVAGITLGGGVGFLSRKYGLTIDSLLAAEIVTADGQIRLVDADHDADLFWAIRGGGGNFGVVTRLKFRLHEVGTVLGGTFILPATPDVLAAFVHEAESAPDELSIIAGVMKAPPMPFVPAEAHGQFIILAFMVYAGDMAEGEKIVGRFRALAAPIVDGVRPIRYPEMFPPEGGDFHPRLAGRTLFADRFDRRTAETILERLRASTAQMAVTQIRVLGGAVARVPNDATAYAHRDRRLLLVIAAMFSDPNDAATHGAWAADLATAVGAGGLGAYVNFLGDEGEARVREAYPGATWDRLRAVKARYDPTNLFRLNQNIPPSEVQR